jgi:hypothetical protein
LIVDNDYLTWPAGPKDRVAQPRTDMPSEMSIYRRLLAAYRLPSGKHSGILTDFQTKVNKKMTKNSSLC